MTTRILIADDQVLVRTGLRTILAAEDDLEVVGEAADGADVLDRVRHLDPDVVLMDLRMPRMDGLEATRRLAAAPRPKVLVLTTYDRSEDVYQALVAGAAGFLVKDTPAEDLLAGIRAVARGEALLGPSATRRVIEQFTRTRHAPLPEGFDELTPRERDVLLGLARGRSNAELAAELVVTPETVKTHVSRVLTKLDLRDRVQAVVLAYETGLVRPGDR